MSAFADEALKDFGGLEGLQNLVLEFYQQLNRDLMIGFLFRPFPIEKLVDGQVEYVRRLFGDHSGTYPLRSLKEVHQALRINAGQFDRRQKILVDLLRTRKIPEAASNRWLQADHRLKAAILYQNATKPPAAT